MPSKQKWFRKLFFFAAALILIMAVLGPISGTQIAYSSNVLVNGSFDGGMSSWIVECTSGTDGVAPNWFGSLHDHSGIFYHHSLYACASSNSIKQVLTLSAGVYSYSYVGGCADGTCEFITRLEENGSDVVPATQSNDFWDTAWDVRSHDEFSITVSGTYTMAVYMFADGSPEAAQIDSIDLEFLRSLATAYATPLPPQPTACATAMPSATATHQPTPTPFSLTPLPTGTPLPPVATPRPSFDSGVATFDSTLSPWTILAYNGPNEFEINASWSSAIGADLSRPGTAFLPYQIDTTALTRTITPAGAIVFPMPPNTSLPLRLTGEFMSDPVPVFHSHYIQVFYFDRDYNGPGQGVWSRIGIRPVSSLWQRLDFTIPISPSAGSGNVTAIAMQGISSGTPEEAEAGLTPGGYTFDSRAAGAFADNLRIYSGPQAVAGSFPTCQGSGAGGPRPIVTKTCSIRQIVVVVHDGCVAPTGIDVSAWLAYVLCRIQHYFSFLPQNRQQITDLIARQNADEPFGTFIEVNDIVGVMGDLFKDISATYQTNAASYRTIDWSIMWNFRQLDDIQTLLHIPNDPGILQRYRAVCPLLSQDSMNSNLFRQYGCLIIVFTRDKLPLFGAFQWVIDISSILGLVISARKFLSNIST